ncbi:MAG: uracil-DNA glycosylase family protein [Comamonas sp.]
MSLNLDTRQRAMLQEMGHPLWWPESAAPAPQAGAVAPAAAFKPKETLAPASRAPEAPENIANDDCTVLSEPSAAPTSTPVDISAPAPERALRDAPVPAAAIPQDFPRVRFALRTPVLLDLRDAKAQTEAAPAATKPAWLLVAELPDGVPPKGAAGQLVINMLRAMGLTDAPVYWVPLARIAPGQADTNADEQPDFNIDALVQDCQPCMAVLLGLPAARHLIGGDQSLVNLRQQIHQLGSKQLPAIVSYDPSYLLRTPKAKGETWADLCRALAHAGR